MSFVFTARNKLSKTNASKKYNDNNTDERNSPEKALTNSFTFKFGSKLKTSCRFYYQMFYQLKKSTAADSDYKIAKSKNHKVLDNALKL